MKTVEELMAKVDAYAAACSEADLLRSSGEHAAAVAKVERLRYEIEIAFAAWKYLTTEMEREACAKIVEDHGMPSIAAAIRARGQDDRCPHIIQGEQCGRRRGHQGKCVWANGD